jgi:pimeloyl-ACP methyl ester carboxylesterase
MARWRRITRIAGVTAGVTAGAAAAGVGAVIAAERLAANRLRLSPDPEAAEPLGELRGRGCVVLAPDGVPLHVEVDGADDAPVTIVFCHGYALHQDCWHYQRRDLAGRARLVFWDQRGHGRSGRAASTGPASTELASTGPASTELASTGAPVSVDQTGDDLEAVLKATVPGRARVVLVGHSMGGMTIMALAGGHPELFGPKVAGVVLIATAAGGLGRPDGLMPGLPSPLRTFLQKAAPTVLRGVAAGRRAALVERGRLASRELELLATRFLAFGDPQASLSLTEFVERMIREAPVGVIADFYGALLGCDQSGALATLGRVPVTVITGDKDRLIPPRLGAELAAGIPGARMAVVAGAGHALMLERPDVVNDAIISMLDELPQGKQGRRRFLRGRDRSDDHQGDRRGDRRDDRRGDHGGERKGEEDVA